MSNAFFIVFPHILINEIMKLEKVITAARYTIFIPDSSSQYLLALSVSATVT